MQAYIFKHRAISAIPMTRIAGEQGYRVKNADHLLRLLHDTCRKCKLSSEGPVSQGHLLMKRRMQIRMLVRL